MAVRPGALSDPALSRLWDVVAKRLQDNGLVVRGTVTLEQLEQAERFALAGLLGRAVTAARARVDLVALDRRLCDSGTAPGLVAAANELRGPLVDRRGERAARAARKEAVWTAFGSRLGELGLDTEPWCETWASLLHPLVGADPAPAVAAALGAAARAMASLRAGGSARGRNELAAQVVGDSHGLDDGSLAGAMVVRGIAARLGVPAPATAEGRRALWERAGVFCDEVSTTVLCLGIFPPVRAVATSLVDPGTRAHNQAASSLVMRSAAGWETHLSLRDLRRLDGLVEKGTEIFVCENPRVLEAAMDAGSLAVVVCTSGNPTVVATRLLERLASDGAHLRYRGDFDWPGISMANRLMERYGTTSWRMGTVDYEAALARAGRRFVDLPRLEGRAVAAGWDSDLAPAMERAGRAVHEEAMLDLLLADLA